jgi:hypothetical protein
VSRRPTLQPPQFPLPNPLSSRWSGLRQSHTRCRLQFRKQSLVFMKVGLPPICYQGMLHGIRYFHFLLMKHEDERSEDGSLLYESSANVLFLVYEQQNPILDRCFDGWNQSFINSLFWCKLMRPDCTYQYSIRSIHSIQVLFNFNYNCQPYSDVLLAASSPFVKLQPAK